jgi:hypothetical protein
MALSTLESTSARTRVPHPVCPRCGHCVDMRLRLSFIETGFRVLAGLVLAILYHPLEDWTQY